MTVGSHEDRSARRRAVRRDAVALARALPLVALVAAAADSAWARASFPYRPAGPELLLQAAAVWLVLAALALAPALLVCRALARLSGPLPRGGRALVLAACTVLPVAVHGVLDRHVGLGMELGALARPRPWLEVGAAVALAAGAVAASAALVRRIGAPRPLWVAAVALLVGLFLPLGAESAPEVAAAGPAPEQRPNLLLLVWDTCRADRTAPYGYERPTTPGLAELAEESHVFADSVSVSSFTFTSHLSMLTGVLPSTHGARLLRMRHDPARVPSIARLLREAGYRTAAFVGTDVLSGTTGIRDGFEVYDDRVDPPVCDTRAWALVHDVQSLAAELVPALGGDGQPHWFQDFQRPAEEVLARAAEWIGRDDPRPWFCLVNLYDTHWPYEPDGPGRALVRPYDGPVDGHLFRSDGWAEGYEIRPEDARHVADLHEGELLELDAEVAAFLDGLALEDGSTAVVVTSDHGEAFGEGGVWLHDDVHETQLRVPLVVRPPAPEPEGVVRTEPASGIDVAPTLLGLAGVPVPEHVEGVDLLGDEVPRDRAVVAEDRDHLDPRDVNVVLYRDGYKLVRRGLGADATYALFDLAADPLGERDVAADEPERLAAMRAELDALRSAADAVEGGERAAGRSDQAEALRALGYAGG